MSTYDNEKIQILTLKEKFSVSENSIAKSKDKGKYEICKAMNKSVVELINKYQKIEPN